MPFDTGLDEYRRTVFSTNYRCLANSPIDLENDIVDYIDNSGIAEKSIDLFYGSARTLSQNPEVLVISTGGFESKNTHTGGKLLRPTFQVLVYDTDHDGAAIRSYSIYNLLNGLTNVTL